MDFETAKTKKKPNMRTVPIALDPEWAAKVEEAQGNRGAAEIGVKTAEILLEQLPVSAGDDDIAEAQRDVDNARRRQDECDAALDELMTDADDKIVKFKLRALSANEVDDIRAAHPATPEQKEEARRNKSPAPPWNYETFHPALVHAALVEPHWSLEQVTEIWNDENWNVAELRALYSAADALTNTMQVIDLGEG